MTTGNTGTAGTAGTAGPRWWPALDPDTLGRVRALADAAAAEDATEAFSEASVLDLDDKIVRGTTRHLLLTGDDELYGYAHVDVSDSADVVVELAVAPGHRRGGAGTALVRAVLDAHDGARFWAHGDHPGARRIADRLGLPRDRELWMMRRDGGAGPLPARPAPPDVVIEPFRVGVDEEAVVAVNGRAFAWHPEQGAMTAADVRVREGEPWFDAAGFLLARDARSGELLGFHWTKVHERSASTPERVGEVYVVGVDPAAQGRGLGSALTLAGLHHLHGRGLDTVTLYVEGDNPAAIATYRKLGFDRIATDVSYRRGT